MTTDASAFIDALQDLEQSRDVQKITALFSEDARVSNPLMAETGKDGAARFWSAYRAAFDSIASNFSTILEHDGRVCLEWTSAGKIDGLDVAYEGVSILEVGDGGIDAFRTYFDPAKLNTVKKAEA